MKKLLRLLLNISVLTCYTILFPPTAYSNPLASKEIKVNQPDYDISYTIEPFYDINVFRFIVVMEFKGNPSGETRIILPNEYGGKNNLPGIKFLKPLSEDTHIIDGDKPELKIVKYPAGSNAKIYYQVEEIRHGDIEIGNHLMVVLRRQYFHFIGKTFFIVPDWNEETECSIRLEWKHMPTTWNLANSFGINQKLQSVKIPFWKFGSSIFTGGDFRIINKTISSNPVYISLRGNWRFSDSQISDLVGNIIESERKFWGDFNYPFFLVTVLPVEGSSDQEGIQGYNSYGLFMSKDRIIDYRLKRGIAYKSFQTWLGGKITFSKPEQLLYWFEKGFSEYYSRLILLRSNLISLDEYVNEFDNILDEYYTSSQRNEKNERLIKEYWNDPELTRLPILKGDIIAHNLNTVILKNSYGRKSLDDMMREIFQRCSNESLVVSNGSLIAMIRYYAGDQTVAEIMRALNSGAPLKMNPEALGPCFNMKIDSYKRFWLIGEQYDVPIFQYKYESLQNERSCMDWFLRK